VPGIARPINHITSVSAMQTREKQGRTRHIHCGTVDCRSVDCEAMNHIECPRERKDLICGCGANRLDVMRFNNQFTRTVEYECEVCGRKWTRTHEDIEDTNPAEYKSPGPRESNWVLIKRWLIKTALKLLRRFNAWCAK
jgi:hypothetical protein